MDLEKLIEQRHQHEGKWVVLRELRESIGRNVGAIDLAAFSCWKPREFHAYEIKRDRRDFERELSNPNKRKWVEANFHYTWFVCERNVCEDREIPEGWGLLIPDHGSYSLQERIAPRRRTPGPMPEGMCLSAMRNIINKYRHLDSLHDAIRGLMGIRK